MALINISPDQANVITQAVADAAAGDTLVLAPGTYREHVVIKKSLTLMGRGDGPVWIDAEAVRPHGIVLDGVAASGSQIIGIGVKRSMQSLVRAVNGVGGVTICDCDLQDFNTSNHEGQFNAGIANWEGGPGWRIIFNRITRRVEVEDVPGAGVGPQRGHGHCIWFKGTNSKPSGGGHVIEFNQLRGGKDGIGCEKESDSRGGFDRDTRIRFNVISEMMDDGIQVEGGCQNVLVEYNWILECGTGIALAPVLTGPLTLRRNIIISSTQGMYDEVVGFKVGRHEGAAEAIIEENFVRVRDDGIKQSNGGLYKLTVLRNSFECGRYVYEFEDVPAAGSRFEGNYLSTRDDARKGRFIKWGGAGYRDLAAFRAATGQELTGTGPGAPPPYTAPTVAEAWAIVAARIGEQLGI